jgi:hypothetical protein
MADDVDGLVWPQPQAPALVVRMIKAAMLLTLLPAALGFLAAPASVTRGRSLKVSGGPEPLSHIHNSRDSLLGSACNIAPKR